jgi:flagellin-like protein
MKRIGEKKALSPVVATILLIAMTIVIALIVFLWFRGLTEEQITKFGGTNIKIVCDDVYFEASYSSASQELLIRNSGNVPIYNFKIKEMNGGSYTTNDLKDLSTEWSANYQTGLNQGMSFSDEISITGDEIVLIPVLIGNSDKGKKTYVCDENQHGYQIIL